MIEAKKQGATVPGVGVARLKLLAPPALEQQRTVTAVDRRFSMIREVAVDIAANLKRAQAFRSAVLARASGAA